ncbi:MAG: hypothetical protein KAU23_04875 [Anaerolineales bacterium]|nr:hypothetical protein [Anaerolineales bacterium]
MKRTTVIITIVISLSLILSACGTGLLPTEKADDASIEETVQAKFAEAAAKTAVLETAVAKELTEQAPPPTATFTSTPEFTETPLPTDTPSITDTPTLEPTSENPWIMQTWCEEHSGCVKVRVENKTDDWAQITLTYNETGQVKFFTVAPRRNAWITLLPGSYRYVFNFCGGKHQDSGWHNLNANWYILAKCKY